MLSFWKRFGPTSTKLLLRVTSSLPFHRGFVCSEDFHNTMLRSSFSTYFRFQKSHTTYCESTQTHTGTSFSSSVYLTTEPTVWWVWTLKCLKRVWCVEVKREFQILVWAFNFRFLWRVCDSYVISIVVFERVTFEQHREKQHRYPSFSFLGKTKTKHLRNTLCGYRKWEIVMILGVVLPNSWKYHLRILCLRR